MRVNLIAPEKKGLSVNWVKIIMTIIIVVLLAGVGFNFYLLHMERNSLKKDIEQHQKELEMLQPLLEEFRQLQTDIEELKAEEFPEIQEYRWDAPLLHLSRIIPEQAILNNLQINENMISVTGNADSAEDLSQFISGLQKSGLFQQVELTDIVKQERVNFTINARVNEGAETDVR